MADKKSILEEAMLDIKSIQNALNANTKEMLRSVAKEEIDSVVKESLVKEIYEEEDIDTEEEPLMDKLGGEEGSEEEDSLGDIEAPADDLGMAAAPEMGVEEPAMGDEMGMDTDVLGGDDMDMTAASDDEVMAVFKKLSGSDEIEIVGDEIHMNISEPGEYIVKMTGGAPAMGGAPEMGDMGGEAGLDGLEDMGGDEEGPEDVDYEIEMGDDEEEPADNKFGGEEGGEEKEEKPDFGGEEDKEEDKEEGIEEEMEEEGDMLQEKDGVGIGGSVGSHRNPMYNTIGANMHPKPKGEKLEESLKTKKMLVETANKYNRLLTEAMKLKAENEEFRAALKDFRTKLVETVIFNSNLTYATKLFLEHSTTKSEKDTIIKRFDEVTSLTESKKLYKTIAGELRTRKPISESLESKIIKESTTSVSKQLNESTAYVDPSTKRIMDLIKRVENR